MSTVAIITDTHFGARGDSDAMQRNQAKFFERVFFPTLDRHGVTHVLHGGDYGDRRKYINFNTAQFIHNTYRMPLKSRGITETILVGNHDCFFKETTHTNSIEELCRHDNAVSIVKDPVEYDFAGCSVLLLPWICDANRDASIRLIQESQAPIVLGHLELRGFQQYKGLVSHEGLDPGLFARFERVLSGHFHHKSSVFPIDYLGAPYPMTWGDYDDPRGFHLFDTQTHELTFIDNPHSLFRRLVYDDEGKTFDYIETLLQSIVASDSPYRESYTKVVVRQKTQPYWFELLMAALYKANVLNVHVVDDIVVNDDDIESRAATPDEDTPALMRKYVESLSINCDKATLDAYLQSLYHEALTANQAVRFL
jgi:DNA repair exonuclease SbcCD nuclease subunit